MTKLKINPLYWQIHVPESIFKSVLVLKALRVKLQEEEIRKQDVNLNTKEA